MLLDAAFIYGTDLQSLPYKERCADYTPFLNRILVALSPPIVVFFSRMQHIHDLCDTVDFAEVDSVKIISPPLLTLTELQTFMQE